MLNFTSDMKKENKAVKKTNIQKPQKGKTPPESTSINKEKIKTISKTVPHEENLFTKDIFPIVGIGASAGGLAAIESFLKSIPTNVFCNMAIVIVQHLDPDHKSILVDIVKQYTKMEVSIIANGIKVKPNCVYVIPPNNDLALLNGRLHLLEREKPRGFHLPIDSFFRSLADSGNEQFVLYFQVPEPTELLV